MEFDVNIYRTNKKFLIYKLTQNPKSNRVELCREISAYTSVPIIAILYYLGEIEGFTEQIRAEILGHMNFYGIDKLKNAPEF